MVFVDPMDPDHMTVVEFPGSPDQLIWSPDGQRLAVSYHTDDKSALGVVSRDGSGLRMLVERQGLGLIPSVAWLAPDEVLAADSVRFEHRVVAYDVVTGESKEYDTDAGGFPGPVLSPDGKRLAFGEYCGVQNPTPGVWVFELEGENARRVDSVCGHLTDLAWSPDGSEIAYTAWYTTTDYRSDPRPDTTGGLYVVNLSLGETRRITDPGPGEGAEYGFGEAVEVGVEWESDGSGFRVRRDHRYNCDDCGDSTTLVLVSADGSEETPITVGQVEATSENAIAYTNDEGFLISPLERGEGKLLLKHDDEWRFRLAEFSPDGQWIAFTRFHCGDCVFP